MSQATRVRPPAQEVIASRPLRVVAVACLVGTVVAAGIGVRLAAPLLAHPGRQAALDALADPSPNGVGVGTAVRTSFGALKVTEVQQGNGLSDVDLGGMAHGVSGLVGVGSEQVNVVLTLTNATDHPVGVRPGEFTLRTGRGSATGAGIAVVGTTLQAGMLPAGASVDARVTFVAKTDGSGMWLQLTEPGHTTPILVSLGMTATVTPHAGGHEHEHISPVPLPPGVRR